MLTSQQQEISPERKKEALESVIHSATFARADQLKNFIRYVCEKEISGQADEISEYSVGVNALGRPAGFSPVEDTSVRNRAYALRHKLETFYRDESPDAGVRIEFPKGTYVPRFVEAYVSGPPEELEPTLAPAPPPVPSPLPSAFRKRHIGFAIAVGCLIGASLTALSLRVASPAANAVVLPVVAPIVREAWGTLLDPGGFVLISVATGPQLTVLPVDPEAEGPAPAPPHPRLPKELYDWYVQHHRLNPGQALYMTPNLNSPHFGDMMAAVLAIQTLNAAGVRFQLFPERVVPSATVYSRNAILIGAPHKSEAVLKQLEHGRYEIRFNPELRDFEVVETAANGSKKVYPTKRDDRNNRTETFALITVRPAGEGNRDRIRNVSFASDPSAGAMAAVEYFSSPDQLSQLKQKLRAQGARGFPRAYQVLIRCEVDGDLVVRFNYESSQILEMD